MDSKLVIFAGLLVLLCLVDSGISQKGETKASGEGKIKCYQCNSYDNQNCADPFFYEEEAEKEPMKRTMKDPSMLQECEDPKATLCRKIYQNVRGDERVIRTCGWVEDPKGRECYTTVLEEYNTEVCSCDPKKTFDGCNGATGYSISLLATLSAVVLAYLIH